MKYWVMVMVLCSAFAKAQSLPSHQWNDRVIIVSADEQNIATLQKQLQLFEKHAEAMAERKLVVYALSNTVHFYSYGRKSKARITQSGKRGDSAFSFELIGLDGTKKYTSTTLVTVNDLFALIDGMSMRRAELKKQ